MVGDVGQPLPQRERAVAFTCTRGEQSDGEDQRLWPLAGSDPSDDGWVQDEERVVRDERQV